MLVYSRAKYTRQASLSKIDFNIINQELLF